MITNYKICEGIEIRLLKMNYVKIIINSVVDCKYYKLNYKN